MSSLTCQPPVRQCARDNALAVLARAGRCYTADQFSIANLQPLNSRISRRDDTNFLGTEDKPGVCIGDVNFEDMKARAAGRRVQHAYDGVDAA
ncbi:hypothetical protein N7523_010322 [Penicillium sp. IBT 18751x]|nr:hypothetical protein N7523_010322 [Penicillium sp. IBT 18751x]